MERQSNGSRDLEAYYKGGQDPPRAVVPPKKKKNSFPPLHRLKVLSRFWPYLLVYCIFSCQTLLFHHSFPFLTFSWGFIFVCDRRMYIVRPDVLSTVGETSKGGYILITLPRIVTPYRDSVDGTRDRVTDQKLVKR
jgi:hypothetical protein